MDGQASSGGGGGGGGGLGHAAEVGCANCTNRLERETSHDGPAGRYRGATTRRRPRPAGEQVRRLRPNGIIQPRRHEQGMRPVVIFPCNRPWSALWPTGDHSAAVANATRCPLAGPDPDEASIVCLTRRARKIAFSLACESRVPGGCGLPLEERCGRSRTPQHCGGTARPGCPSPPLRVEGRPPAAGRRRECSVSTSAGQRSRAARRCRQGGGLHAGSVGALDSVDPARPAHETPAVVLAAIRTSRPSRAEDSRRVASRVLHVIGGRDRQPGATLVCRTHRRAACGAPRR